LDVGSADRHRHTDVNRAAPCDRNGCPFSYAATDHDLHAASKRDAHCDRRATDRDDHHYSRNRDADLRGGPHIDAACHRHAGADCHAVAHRHATRHGHGAANRDSAAHTHVHAAAADGDYRAYCHLDPIGLPA
jgi:hypothetical protein